MDLHLEVTPDHQGALIAKLYNYLGRQMTGLTNPPLVSSTPGTSRPGQTAFLDPTSWVIEVDASLVPAGVDMASVRPSNSLDMASISALHGVMIHEEGHAVHTLADWRLIAETHGSKVLGAVKLIEEARMEARSLIRRPVDKPWLRSAIRQIVAQSASEGLQGSKGRAAGAAALLLARVDGGTLREADVADVREVIAAELGADKLAELEVIWRQFLQLGDADTEGHAAVGRMWVDACDWAQEDDGEPGEGQDGFGDGALGEAVNDALGSVATTASQTVTEAAERDEAAKDRSRAQERTRTEENASKTDARAQSQRVFAAVDGTHATTSTRIATAQEKAAAARLTDRLRTAMAPNVAKTRVTTNAPGRYVPSKGVQYAAQLATGTRPNVDRFVRTKRVLTEKPRPVVGMAVDLSGSMTLMAPAAAQLLYIVSHGFHPLGGTMAAVEFSTDVRALLKPRERPVGVPVMKAAGGTSGVYKALQALDGALPLDDSRLVRMVVLVTDNDWPEREGALSDQLIRRWLHNGVQVLSINSGWVQQRAHSSVSVGAPLDSVSVIAERLLAMFGN